MLPPDIKFYLLNLQLREMVKVTAELQLVSALNLCNQTL